jgi:nicotinamidase-related amidase
MVTPRRALVVVDVQNEYFAGPLAIQYPPREASLANIVAAIEAAHAAGLPVLVVRHVSDPDSPVFADGSVGAQLHPDVESRIAAADLRVTKDEASVLTVTEARQWLADQHIETLTLVGYMTNNCIIATAAHAEPLGLGVEVLSDATGAINLVNEAGTIPARQVHETLLALMQSNWAAVATTEVWRRAVAAGVALTVSNLIASATSAAIERR